MIFTSLSPNTQNEDVLLAFKLLLQPWKWKGGVVREKLEQEFSQYLSVPHTFAFESGRTSLYAVLKALNLSSTDEVILQSYTCVAVPEPVLWAGAQPVYVDCLSDFTMDPEDLRKKITPKSKVLIIQHTFGLAADMDELVSIAREHGLFVIEDCAHALGAEYKGKKVGTFGDAGFFSFGRDKVISSVFGGMLAIQDDTLAGKVKAIQDSFRQPSHFWIKQQLNHPVIFTIGKSCYSFLRIGKTLLKISGMIGVFSRAVEPIERQGGIPHFAFHKLPDALASLALLQFKKLEAFNVHRNAIAEIYEKVLYKRELVDTKRVYLRYTILVPDPAKVMSSLKKSGVMLGDWYATAIAPVGVVYEKIHYDPATCPNAEMFAQQSINLPTHIQISEKDAYRIAELVLKEIN